MDIDEIQKLIAKHRPRVDQIYKQRDYAGGRHTAILSRPAHEEPDNRIPTPIARKALRFVAGYMAKPGNIVYTSEPEGYYDEILKPIFDSNDEGLTTQELFETALTHGEAWEYHWTENNGDPQFGEIPVEQCIPIWSDDIPSRRKLEGFIRYYTIGEIHKRFYWDDTSMYSWEGKDETALAELPAVPHGFGEVPFAQYPMSRDLSNLFDCVVQLIDFHDRIVSEDYANELQRFATAYLLLADKLDATPDENGESEIDKLKRTRTFEGLGGPGETGAVTDKVNFLIKQIQEGFIGTAADRFERLIYEMMMVINPNDDKFGAADSGIAMAYKLLQFEYLCASIESYISRGLQKRIWLIQNIKGNMSADAIDRPQVSILFRRNLPHDMESAVEQFVKVAGILPDEDALRLFPASFITNIKKTLQGMADMRDANIPEEDTNGGTDSQDGDDTE